MDSFSTANLTAFLLSMSSRVGGALLVFAGFWIASLIVPPLLGRVGKRTPAHHAALLELGGQCAKIAWRVFGVVSALGTLGVDVSALVAGLGLTGFALGFALKDVISNVLAGVLILFYRPFGRGDHITSAGMEGLVTNIDLRYTTLLAGDKRILIPNSNLLTNAIVVNPPPAETTAIIEP